MAFNIKKFYEDYKHVMSISYRPNMQEFMRTLKVVLLGTLATGVLGYIISIIIGKII